MGLPPEKYSYKVIGNIMATFIDKLNLHDVSKTMFLTMFARAKETQRERPLFRNLKAVEIKLISALFRSMQAYHLVVPLI